MRREAVGAAAYGELGAGVQRSQRALHEQVRAALEAERAEVELDHRCATSRRKGSSVPKASTAASSSA